MPAHSTVVDLFGWHRQAPNFADRASAPSTAIASSILEQLGVVREVKHVGQTAGTQLEQAVEVILGESLPPAMAPRKVRVCRLRPISDFAQYSHLTGLEELIRTHPDTLLRATIGTDYRIVPDVVVELPDQEGEPGLLHAAVPCKWTLRSDRAQNVRHEAVMMIRHRRGRLPHIAPVTAEPLPTRIASLARGTGEVDFVYHVALDELVNACRDVGGPIQTEVIEELIENDRLRDLNRLAFDLAN